jgi:3-deoxy-7-phosphoheptulonate synthase
MSPGELVRICDRLDPWREPGRLTLVFRLGAVRTGELLPPLLGAVREAGREPLLVCDPMHGNPYVFSPDGTRGRSYDDVLAEAVAFPAIVAGEGMRPAGLHLEVAADMVTECAGGPGGPDLEELGRDYRTICDPRLNPEQALAVTEAFAAALRR